MIRFASVVVAAVIFGCARDPGESTALTVFVAASLRDAVETVGERFTSAKGREIVFNFASSGTLAQQLQAAGGPDVFLSASARWVDRLEGSGRVASGSRRAFLSNRLAVVVRNDSALEGPVEDLFCSADGFSFLSIGDPSHVPAGRYAQGWLMQLPCGGSSAWEHLRDRVNPAPDVRAALNQLLSDSRAVGIVYQTDYKLRAEKLRLLKTVEGGEAPVVEYHACALGEARNPEIAAEFLDFLRSPEAVEIFSGYGFVVPE